VLKSTENSNTELARSLRSRHVSMIAIGGIIGAGLFVGSSTSIATVGPAVVISYALAGFLVLLVMRILTEMAIVRPGLGSFTEFVRAGLGDWAGFISGWLYWYFWVIVVPIEVIAGANILQLWMPFEMWEIGIVLLALMTAINLTSTRSYGEFEFWLSSLKVAAIIAFIAVAGSYAFGLTSPSGPTFANLTAGGGFAPFGMVAIFAGVTSVIFALTGAEIATIAAAEANEPERTIARITSSVAVRILLFYVISIFLIVSVVSWKTVLPGVSPFATALEAMDIPGAGTVMNFIVLVAVLSCLNSGLYVTSRVLFVLASRGDAPQSLVKLSWNRVPVRSILFGSAFGYLALAAAVLSPQGVFSFLVNASGALMLFIYLMLCVAQIKERDRLKTAGLPLPSVRMWLHPWSTYIVIVGIVAVLAAMALTPALASQLYLSLMVTAVAGAGYWYKVRRARTAPPPEKPADSAAY
jgi:GABA permease